MSVIDSLPPLSELISRPLRRVADRAWGLRVARALLQTMVVVLSTWLLVVLLLGWFPMMGASLRWVLVVLAWGVLALALAHFLPAAFRRRTLDLVARDVEAACPDVQERLSSAVEISRDSDPRFRGSAELVAHLIRQAEQDAGAVDPQQVVSARHVLVWGLYLLPVLFGWALLTSGMTPAVTRGLYRLFAPWSNEAIAAFSTISVTPGDSTIAQGSPFKVTVEALDPTRLSRTVQDAQLTQVFPGGQARSEPMERTGPRFFQWTTDAVQQPFTYSVHTTEGDSAIYTVRVLPLPAVVALDAHLQYPAYTRLPARVLTSTDGNLTAPVGTRIDFTLHTNQPLTADRCAVVLGEGTPDLQRNPLVDAHPGAAASGPANGDNAYNATVTVARSGPYYFDLLHDVGQHELKNRDPQQRTITAVDDAAPVVIILSPGAHQRVRPDDVVPIAFAARDDYGLALLEMSVQVDGLPVRVQRIDLPDDQRKDVRGTWALNVAQELARANQPRARTITYQLKALDTHEPVAQQTLSAAQTLDLDPNAESYALKADEENARALADAIADATRRLDEAEHKLAPLEQRAAEGKPADEQQNQGTEALKQQLAETSEKLTAAADAQRDGTFAATAAQLKTTADETIRDASDSVGRAQLAPNEPTDRAHQLGQAERQIAQAREELQQAQQQLGQQAALQHMQRSTEQLAARQQQVADAMTRNDPQQQPQVADQQRELQKELDQLVAQNPPLQQPVAESVAPQVDKLLEKLDALQARQDPLERAASARQAAAHAQDAAGKLAARQQKLNEQVKQLAAAQKPTLNQADTQVPTPDQLDPIVQELQQNKLPNAAQHQAQSAAALEQAAQRLDAAHDRLQRGDTPAGAPGDPQVARDFKQQAEQLAKDIQAAKNWGVPAVRPTDPANRKAREIAQDMQKELDRLPPAARRAAQQARQLAQQADQASRKGRADDAQHALDQAADAFEKAINETNAARSPQKDQAQAETLAQAGAKTHALAEEQRALSTEAAALAQAQHDAGNVRPEELTKQQDQLAKDINAASDEAGQIAKETAAAPAVAERARKAAESLQNSSQEQQQAAQASGSNDLPRADHAQQQAAERLQQASDALRGIDRLAQGESPDAPPEHPQDAGEHPAQQPAQEAAAPESGAPHAAGSETAQGQQPEAGQAQVAQAAHAVQAAREAQHAAAAGDSAAAHRSAEQLGRASQLLAQARGNGPPEPAAQGLPEPGAPHAGMAHQGISDGQGVQAGASIAADARPDAVKQIGVPPSDWARLPARLQQQLLTAAQQPGPAAYQEMIKNYYLQIARLGGGEESTR